MTTTLTFPPERSTNHKKNVFYVEDSVADLGLIENGTYLGIAGPGFGFQVSTEGETRVYVIPFNRIVSLYEKQDVPLTPPGQSGLVVPNGGVPQEVLDQMLRGGPLGRR